MSLPRRPSPSRSPTPSKSSLRRASGAHGSSQRNLLPPASPRFEEEAVPLRYSPRSPPNQTLEYDSQDDELSEEEQKQAAFPPLAFQPFFTLIEDNLTSEHHHPYVHYIFADDDHEIITEAALRSLEQDDQESTTQLEQDEAARLPPPRLSVREHYLILDIQPIDPQTLEHVDGSVPQPSPAFAVSASRSLSSDWQVLHSTITSAPTMGDNIDQENEGLMLRIEGRGVTSLDKTLFQEDNPDTRENVEEMIERFQSRLGDIRSLMEADILLSTQVEGGVESQD